MKIFHCVESYYPAVGGMQEVVKQLSERLVKLGHEVVVFTRFHPDRRDPVINGVRVEQFNIIDNPKEAVTEEERRYVSWLLALDEGVITFFAAQQWATDLALPVLGQIRIPKVSVPTGYSGLYWPGFREYFEKMKTYIHGYDMNVYLSNDYRDINFARENNVDKRIIIPNGAAADEFLPGSSINVRKALNIPEDHFLILHVGSYTGWKGHADAIEIFLRSSVRKGTLLMIGNNYENFKRQYVKRPSLALRYLMARISGRKRIIFKFFPRDFTVAAYKQSDLFLFPSNIECSPIVLFECAAARLPFLSTDAGNAVEISNWTGGGMILPTKKDTSGFSHADITGSVNMLNEIYSDAALREKLGKRAHEEWGKNFSWEIITRKYESLYRSLTAK